MRVAIVGATGLVGSKIIEILEERNFPVSELIPVASSKSAGKKLTFKNTEYTAVTPEVAVAMRPSLALFSAGGSVSQEWAPKFAEQGTVVIDNSSAWRMDATKKLVIPEINASVITANDKIIANPNCSTIQMLMPLAPLHARYTIRRIVVSTYQSVTGTGAKALNQLYNERKGVEGEMAYSHPIDLNAIPQIDIFLENGYTKEEMKMVNETHKIMRDSSIRVTATTVRIPVIGGHSESINVEFAKDFDLNEVRLILENTPGIVVKDEPAMQLYPMPLSAHNRNEVFVGRLRRDESQEKALNMWVVADNLRKGAATNAIQIAEYMYKKGFIG